MTEINENAESDPHNDAPEIESHRRDRAGVVREFRGRGPDPTFRARDGRELHGHQGASRPHLPGGIGPDQGERIIRAYIIRSLYGCMTHGRLIFCCYRYFRVFMCAYRSVHGPIMFSNSFFFFPALNHPHPRAHSFAPRRKKRANRRKRYEEYSTSATTSRRTRRIFKHAARITLDRDRGVRGVAAAGRYRGEERAVVDCGDRNTSDGSDRSHSCRRRFQFTINACAMYYCIYASK